MNHDDLNKVTVNNDLLKTSVKPMPVSAARPIPVKVTKTAVINTGKTSNVVPINAKEEKKELVNENENINVLDLSHTVLPSDLKEVTEDDVETLEPELDLNRIIKPVSAMEASNINEVKPREYKNVVIEVKTNYNYLFSITILSLVSILLFVVCLITMPTMLNYPKYKIKESISNNLELNKKYTVNSYKISDNYITSNDEFTITDDYIIKTNKLENTISILVNDKEVGIKTNLYNTVGIVDNLLVLAGDNSSDKTSTIYIVNKSGDIIKQIENCVVKDMKIINGTFDINSNNIIFEASRVNKNNVLINNHELDFCDKYLLFQNRIDGEFIVGGKFKISYLGNNTFSDPEYIYFNRLNDYKSKNNYCNSI